MPHAKMSVQRWGITQLLRGENSRRDLLKPPRTSGHLTLEPIISHGDNVNEMMSVLCQMTSQFSMHAAPRGQPPTIPNNTDANINDRLNCIRINSKIGEKTRPQKRRKVCAGMAPHSNLGPVLFRVVASGISYPMISILVDVYEVNIANKIASSCLIGWWQPDRKQLVVVHWAMCLQLASIVSGIVAACQWAHNSTAL